MDGGDIHQRAPGLGSAVVAGELAEGSLAADGVGANLALNDELGVGWQQQVGGLAAHEGDRLAHIQLSDVAGVARELATDADRILPGDGDFQIDRVLRALRAIG